MARAAAGELCAGCCKLLRLERLDSEDEPRQPIVRFAREKSLGQRKCLVHIAVRHGRNKCALEQLGVARIEAQGFSRKCRRSDGIAFGARNDRGKIVSSRALADFEGSRNRQVFQDPCSRRLDR